jgi:hypothetical protein
LPQAIAAGVGWRIFNFPILPMVMIMRIIGLGIYLICCLVVIHILPIGKWVFTILALSPLSLYQVSTLNGDGFTISVCFLFIGIMLGTYHPKSIPVSIKESIIIASSTLLLGMAKPGTIILLPLLFLLLGRSFYPRKGLWIIIVSVILSIAISLGWSIAVVLNYDIGSSGKTRLDQIIFVLQNFGDFIKGYFIGIYQLLPKYYLDWVASYGYWVGVVPSPVFIIFPISLISAYFTEAKNPRFTLFPRLLILMSAIIALSVIASAKFVFRYVPHEIYGNAQARYFLPFAPLFFLSFAGMFNVKPRIQQFAAPIASLLLFVTLSFYGIGLFRTYYSECVYPVDATHPCKLPQYKNLEVKNPPIINLNLHQSITQTFSPHCSKISGISIWPFKNNKGVEGDLRLSIMEKNGQIVRESSIPLENIEERKQISFNFPPIPVQPRGEYLLLLEMVHPSLSSSNLGLLARKEDYYKEGHLWINGDRYPAAADLFFQYECPKGTFQKAGN